MVNSGAIQLQSNSDLAIGANFTITGSGAILAEGANGAENITSDGAAPATFINDSTIIYLAPVRSAIPICSALPMISRSTIPEGR